jgi:L-fucose mutarotase
VNARVLRADGLGVPALLEAILALIELDAYDPPLAMMAATGGDQLDPAVEAGYMRIILRHVPQSKPPSRIERFAFYERARHAYDVVMTSDIAPYGNLILKKGVTPSDPRGH